MNALDAQVARRASNGTPREVLHAACAVLVALAIGCVGSGSSTRVAPLMVTATEPTEFLPIDGIWQRDAEDGALVQIDRGRMYLQDDFGGGRPHGAVIYSGIHQSGPQSYRCKKPRVGDAGIEWRRCVLSVEDGILVVRTLRQQRAGESGRRYRPIALADDVWFEQQAEAFSILSRGEAHRPPPEVPVVAIAPLPDLPPSAPPREPVLAPSAATPYGKYHALVIGTGDYLYLPAVATAEGDADAVSALLRERYGFAVTDLRNPTRIELAAALEPYVEALGPDDNLLVYFAGHGFLSEELGRCYWFPADATGDAPDEGLANDDLASLLRQIPAGRILVVADSCFTASQVRELRLDEREEGPRAAPARLRTRVVLTSGGIEPIQDGNGGNHSVFTGALIEALEQNSDVLDGTRLFAEIQRIVTAGASQSPEYADIRGADHEGGDFLFVPRLR